MPRTLIAAATVVVLACCAVPADGGATTAARGGFPSSRLLWATVDKCVSSPTADVVGVRASMPGTGNRNEQMFMGFRLQYRTHHGWHNVGTNSPLVSVGSARYRSRQAGLDFHLAASTASGTVLRGLVAFQWRIGSVVVHAARRATSAGRTPSAGASPPGYSAARCTIS